MIKNWLLAFRLKTLTAAFVPIVVGTSLVYFEGESVQWLISLWAMLSALCIQIATNLFNDAIDFKKGADTHQRVGPQRVTQSGLMSVGTVFKVAYLFCFLALLFGVPLVLEGGVPILVLGLVSVVMGYLYTGGPYPLAYKGLGDLFVILFFGLAAVCGTYFLHVGELTVSSVVAGLQIGFLSTVLIVINNLRDREQDQKVGKMTLAVRLGVRLTRVEATFLYVINYALLGYWYYRGAFPAIYLSLLSLPVAVMIIKNIWGHLPGPIYNKFLAHAALVHVVFGILFSLGLWL